ncbi:MAG: fatty acid desaturase, partial [Variovorax sp.]
MRHTAATTAFNLLSWTGCSAPGWRPTRPTCSWTRTERSRRSRMTHRLDGLPRLRRRRDWQSLAYLAVFPALAAWQWVHGFWWPFYALMLFLTLGIGVIHHNHTHQRMWRGRRAN